MFRSKDDLRQAVFTSGLFAKALQKDRCGRHVAVSVRKGSESDLGDGSPQSAVGQKQTLASNMNSRHQMVTPDAEYYDRGEVSSAEIVRDINYFTRRWPTRFYRLTSIHSITSDPETDRVFVSYEISYRVANSNKAASGKAYYGAVIANLHSSPKIEWIREDIAN